MNPLNWSILKNPLNYIIVILMLVIAGIGGHFLMSYVGLEPAVGGSSNNGPSTVKPIAS